MKRRTKPKKPFPPGGGNSKRKQILAELRSINKELRKIMPTLQERFDALEANQTTTIDKLNEASTEILAELEKLRAGGDLTPEQEASLQRIEAKAVSLATTATGMADISPPVEPPPEP